MTTITTGGQQPITFPCKRTDIVPEYKAPLIGAPNETVPRVVNCKVPQDAPYNIRQMIVNIQDQLADEVTFKTDMNDLQIRGRHQILSNLEKAGKNPLDYGLDPKEVRLKFQYNQALKQYTHAKEAFEICEDKINGEVQQKINNTIGILRPFIKKRVQNNRRENPYAIQVEELRTMVEQYAKQINELPQMQCKKELIKKAVEKFVHCKG